VTFWRYHSLKPGLVSVYVEMRYWVYPFTIGWFINVDQSDPKSGCLANPLCKPSPSPNMSWVKPSKIINIGNKPLGFIGIYWRHQLHYDVYGRIPQPRGIRLSSPLGSGRGSNFSAYHGWRDGRREMWTKQIDHSG
jgi:hypothetical protein